MTLKRRPVISLLVLLALAALPGFTITFTRIQLFCVMSAADLRTFIDAPDGTLICYRDGGVMLLTPDGELHDYDDAGSVKISRVVL